MVKRMVRTVLVTGGSKGIGLAVAKAYGKRNMQVILAARHREDLITVQKECEQEGMMVDIFAVDLADEQGPFSLFKQYPDIDILVNAAGMGNLGPAVDTHIEKDQTMVDLNCRAVLVLCKLYGKQMQKKRHGLIVNIASTDAYQPGPYTAAYYASKSFVLSYSRALHEELKEDGVWVSCVCPGPVRTDFYEKSGAVVPSYAITPEKTAAYIVKKAEKKTVVICGLRDRLLLCIPSYIRMMYIKHQKKHVLEQVAQEDQEHVEDII